MSWFIFFHDVLVPLSGGYDHQGHSNRKWQSWGWETVFKAVVEAMKTIRLRVVLQQQSFL